MTKRKIRAAVYALLLLLALLLLVLCVLQANPPRTADSYTSVHPAATMAPLMGFSADALVNTGDAKALDKLPGVGEVISQRMIEMRDALGGFRLPEDLLLVKGIGNKTLDKIMGALEEPLVQLEELDE